MIGGRFVPINASYGLAHDRRPDPPQKDTGRGCPEPIRSSAGRAYRPIEAGRGASSATASGRINGITEQIVREHLAALARALGRAAAREAMADQTAAKRSIPSKTAKEI
jgi:hypothetical protein